MSFKRKQFYILFILFLAVDLLLGLMAAYRYGYFTEEVDSLPTYRIDEDVLSKKNSDEFFTYWEKHIDKYGAEHSYDFFVEHTQNIESVSTQHELAHWMGKLLYEKLGVPGITVCDHVFSYGCYHSFMGEAIAAYGIEVAYDLHDRCVKDLKDAGGGCFHGIGHGIVNYLGDERLDEALSLCSSILKGERVSRCATGVFMEYNFHTMDNPSGERGLIRSVESSVYSPCDEVDQIYKSACYAELPKWWNIAVSYEDMEEFGQMCEDVPEKQYVKDCFLGYGEVVASISGFDPKRSIEYCDLFRNEDSSLFCRSGASYTFLVIPSHRGFYKTVCRDESGDFESRCLDIVDELSIRLR